MKKYLGVLLAVFLASGGVFAGVIDLPEANGSGLKIVSEKSGNQEISIRMACSIDKLYFFSTKTPKGEFTVLYSPQFYFGGAYGAPQLPVINRLVQIPLGAKYRIDVKKYDTKVYNLADFGISSPILPRQPSAPKNGSEVPFVYEKSAYISRGFNGPALTSIKEVGIMRHMRLAHISIAPVKYDPVENKVEVYNNIDFEIVLEGSSMSASKAMHDTYWSPAFAWMENIVIVPKSLRFPKKNAAQGYVIVSDPAFKAQIEPFATWKAQKGFKVSVVYTDQFGTGPALSEGVKKFIHNLYNNPTSDTPAPSYVLFVGDHDKIPAFKGQSGSHITDLPYVAVTSGDFLPDILTGRFSALDASQLQPQIDKTIEYEKGNFADPSFLKDVVLIAGWDGNWARSHGWPHINYITKYYTNKENGFNKVSAFLSSGSQQNSAAIVEAVSQGVSYVNYTAHGSSTSLADPSFTLSDIAKLKNKGKYPFVIGNCCLTNKFEVPTCFGEAWLRAKDAGAIGYVGGSNSTYWDEDFWWGVGVHAIVKPNDQGIPPAKEQTGRGAVDSLFEGAGVTNAGFMLVGNLAVEESSSSRKQYYWEIYHLMGDPSLKTRVGRLQ